MSFWHQKSVPHITLQASIRLQEYFTMIFHQKRKITENQVSAAGEDTQLERKLSRRLSCTAGTFLWHYHEGSDLWWRPALPSQSGSRISWAHSWCLALRWSCGRRADPPGRARRKCRGRRSAAGWRWSCTQTAQVKIGRNREGWFKHEEMKGNIINEVK